MKNLGITKKYLDASARALNVSHNYIIQQVQINGNMSH